MAINAISPSTEYFYNQYGYAKPTAEPKPPNSEQTDPAYIAKPEKSRNPEDDPRIRQEIARLKAIEEKVKAHEQAHKSAGGQFAGPVNYQYTIGPDGKRYIVGGEVSISIQEGKTPDETIRNMEIVKRAALAPADPSPQDRAVAAQADAISAKARMQKLKESADKQQEDKAEQSNQVGNTNDDKNNLTPQNTQPKSPINNQYTTDNLPQFKDTFAQNEAIPKTNKNQINPYARYLSQTDPFEPNHKKQRVNLIA